MPIAAKPIIDAVMFPSRLPPVSARPFPHIACDGFLDAGIYRALLESFPECPANSGPTGFSLFWGDDDYAALLDRHPAWRALFEASQSQAFVDYTLAPFREVLAREARVDLSHARFVSRIETRAEKEARHIGDTGLAPDQLFVRPDILQGNTGYDRRAHVDHRRRAATMLIYCCDGDEAEMEGGDLILHGIDGAPVETIRPRHNRMVLFPCVNGSLHSVSRIASQRAPRNFVQITVSSSVDLWEPASKAPTGPLARVKRAFGRLIAS